MVQVDSSIRSTLLKALAFCPHFPKIPAENKFWLAGVILLMFRLLNRYGTPFTKAELSNYDFMVRLITNKNLLFLPLGLPN